VACSDAKERLSLSTSSAAPSAQASTVSTSKPEKNVALKKAETKAVVPKLTDSSISSNSKNTDLPESKAPTAPLLQADSKMSPPMDTKSPPSLSGDPLVTLAETSTSADVDLKAGTTALLPKIESKRSTVDSSAVPQQTLLSLSGDPPIALAASVAAPVTKSPRAMRRCPQKDHKGAASEELLNDYREILAQRGPGRDFESKHDLFVAQQVQSSKSRGLDLVGVLQKLWAPVANYSTFFNTGVFNRELIGVAFHANSVDQAFKRTADFRARVGKLASLRSAGC
jgi:hypothetical protein